jgi:hypothetical protein
LVVRRSLWTARGHFQVRATIYRAPASSSTAEYGLALAAGESGLQVAFLIRPDHRVGVQQTTDDVVTMLQTG